MNYFKSVIKIPQFSLSFKINNNKKGQACTIHGM